MGALSSSGGEGLILLCTFPYEGSPSLQCLVAVGDGVLPALILFPLGCRWLCLAVVTKWGLNPVHPMPGPWLDLGAPIARVGLHPGFLLPAAAACASHPCTRPGSKTFLPRPHGAQCIQCQPSQHEVPWQGAGRGGLGLSQGSKMQLLLLSGPCSRPAGKRGRRNGGWTPRVRRCVSAVTAARPGLAGGASPPDKLQRAGPV